MTNKHFPPRRDEERVRRVLSQYEKQTDKDVAAENAAAFNSKKRTVIQVPVEPTPVIREIAQ
jgi:hypothetical protein